MNKNRAFPFILTIIFVFVAVYYGCRTTKTVTTIPVETSF